ncbi:MAG: TonB-dependent receptor domain-containing protein, partial [Opitutaceae bacterium]
MTLASAFNARAAEVIRIAFSLPADSVEKSLKRFSEQAGREVLFASQITRGVRANPVKGDLSPREAIDSLLANTGLVAVHDHKTGAFSVRKETDEEARKRQHAAATLQANHSREALKKNEIQTPANQKHQQPMKRNKLLTTLTAVVALFAGSPVNAQNAAGTGTIEGRVLNASNGSYLTNARVTVEGTNIQAFTDPAGRYRLTDVPAGETKVKVFYTGLAGQTATIAVQPRQIATHDFDLLSFSAAPLKEGEVVQLDAFTVAARREMDSAAIAINEQRFASHIKNVVSTDAFGDILEGNIGDFVKFLPGVTIDYVAADARAISIRGVGANYTSVTVDGNRIASANSSETGRTFELEQISINNAARIEIFKSRTPDISADALGGSVNLIPRTAFEQATASLNYRAFLSVNGTADKTLSKTPGPTNRASRKIRPGFDLVYTNPVTKNFGYTLSLLESDIFYPQDQTQPRWAPNWSPRPGATVESPYMGSYLTLKSPKNNQRESVGTTMDWRFRPNDVLSVSAQWNLYNAGFYSHQVFYDVGNFLPLAFDRTLTHGAPGRGTLNVGGGGNLRKFGTTYQGAISWRHTGPVWKLDAGVSFSHASNHYHSEQDGHFGSALLRLRGLPNSTTYDNYSPTVRFEGMDQNGYLFPAKITVFDANNANPIDQANPSNYNIVNSSFSPIDSSDAFKTARFNARRELGLAFPFALKTGVLFQEQTRDIAKKLAGIWLFVGPDGQPNTQDDNAGLYDIIHKESANPASAFGTPRVPLPDMWKLYDLFKTNPQHFRIADPTAIFRTPAFTSKWFRETILATYLMADTRLIDNRLRLIGGARFERTKDEGQGVLNNPAAARGITDPIEATKAQYKIRGSHSTITYDGVYPSLDAAFNVTPNFVARAAYAKSIGRPDLSNIIPNTSVPDPTSGNRTISVVNTGLQPTIANSLDLSLEYYFAGTGVFSVGLFQKDFSNFTGGVTRPATLALLNELGVPDAQLYADGGYIVSTKANIGSARVTGWEFNYIQTLDAEWMPRWLRHFTVRANGQRLHLEGST